MASIDSIDAGVGGADIEHAEHMVELAATTTSDSDSISGDQITPLLAQSDKPKINIFSVAFSRRKVNKEQVARLVETDTSSFTQFMLWAWSGSRYSGLLCMALSSSIYCIMEVVADVFSAQSIPLFEIAFSRCTIILLLSFIWLRKSGQPIFGPANVRNLLVSRALIGNISLLSFVYSIQRLPLSQAIVLSFTTPIMASIAARIILHEKLKIAEIGGLACSFFGILFIFRSMLNTQGGISKSGEESGSNVHGIQHVYAILIGLFSSIAGGVTYCLVRAASKASDQPVVTVFSFGALSTPAVAVCAFAFQDFVLPQFYSFFLMVVLGILAFFAEILLARGLQLEKTSKVVNIQYLEVALSQLWGMGLSRVVPSFGRLVGCTLIFVSACFTMFLGPEKEIEQ
ncbi:hypothetical protein LguiA_022762 [Lonicera macranthoides]